MFTKYLLYMNVDYIIVGLGLAGIAFCETLEKHNKSFIVFDNNSQNSSIVAGGVYNPVILKRFTPVWEANNQLKIAKPFYENLEQKFQKQYNIPIPIFRVFKSIEEQNNWFVAADHPSLCNFMIPKIESSLIKGIKTPFGYGVLTNTGWINTELLLHYYNNYLQSKQILIKERFDHPKVQIKNNCIKYKHISTTKIIFCEGFGLKQNPFFNYLPMQEAKGELLIIHAPNLKLKALIKAAVFILPLGNDFYKVGATFNWADKTQTPSNAGKLELIEKLQTVLESPYTIVKQLAGIRPTVKDRRPLVGTHPTHKNLAILNGLGTRGVIIAPTAATQLYQAIEHNISIHQEYTIDRFLTT